MLQYTMFDASRSCNTRWQPINAHTPPLEPHSFVGNSPFARVPRCAAPRRFHTPTRRLYSELPVPGSTVNFDATNRATSFFWSSRRNDGNDANTPPARKTKNNPLEPNSV